MLHKIIEDRRENLDKMIPVLTDKLSNCPSGTLFSRHNSKYTKWYISKEDTTVYLPKKDKSIAEQLAYKKWLELKLEESLEEKKVLELFLKKIKPVPASAELISDERYADLFSSHFHSNDDFVARWQSQEYESNPFHPEQLIHKSPLGYYVRSKSEVMISLSLMTSQIPHLYEFPLRLNNGKCYPDFTLMHPVTHELFYWEHLGLMDDPGYSQEASRKLQSYISNGIIPGINLIITAETHDHPLEYDSIERTISLYF